MADQTVNTKHANDTALSAMQDAYEKCQRSYTAVDSTRDELRASWQGDASTVYQEALIKWLEELRLLVNDMGQKQEQWGGTTHQMYDTEDTNLVTSSRWMQELNPNQ